jgi:uncharacterized protein
MPDRHSHFLSRWTAGKVSLVFAIILTSSPKIGDAAGPDTTPPGKPTLTGKGNYVRPFELVTRSAFIPLPPGAVEPEGWLRDWCQVAKDGYTGHMDEVDPAFQQAWAADYKMTGDQLSYWDRGAWPYEGDGYWLDGLSKLAYALHDAALINKVKSRIDVVANNMNENGILFMWWLDKNKPKDLEAVVKLYGGEANAWPVWANGLMGRTLVGYYASSGDDRAVKALETAYSGTRDWVDLGWSMSNAWPAFETYTWTGNKQIKVSLTELFTKVGDEKKEGSWDRYRRLPNIEPGAESADHGVHFCESSAPWALGYLWTGKREFLDAALGWHELVERDCMQPYGVPVFDEYYGPTGAFRGTETCNVAAYMWSQTLLLSIGGQGRMADRIERAFFNAAPAAVSRDFKTHVYFQAPNRMADKSLPAAGQYTFQSKHHPLCCTASLNRFLPNYVMNMWMATQDDGLASICYGPCKVSALVADHVPLELACRTNYPFNEMIEIAVEPARDATFPLLLRIPGWCKNAELKVNGSAMKASPDANGFVRLERLWKPNDKIQLQFPMSPCIVKGRDANAGDAPYAFVSYGPLLFALPIADGKDANTPDPAARWQFALDTEGDKLGSGIQIERNELPDKWDWPLESPLKLRARAVSIDWKPTLEMPLPSAPFAKAGPSETMILVPYGCTKFRVSMFPVTEKTLKSAESLKKK